MLLVLLVMEKDMQAITTASVLALPLDMEEVTESSDSDEVAPCLFLCFALAGSKLPKESREKSLQVFPKTKVGALAFFLRSF